MTAMDDDELVKWLQQARYFGADDDNYAILRPVLLQLKDKYLRYGHMQEKV